MGCSTFRFRALRGAGLPRIREWDCGMAPAASQVVPAVKETQWRVGRDYMASRSRAKAERYKQAPHLTTTASPDLSVGMHRTINIYSPSPRLSRPILPSPPVNDSPSNPPRGANGISLIGHRDQHRHHYRRIQRRAVAHSRISQVTPNFHLDSRGGTGRGQDIG